MTCGCCPSSLCVGTWASGPQPLCPQCVSPHALQERRSSGIINPDTQWLECSFLAISHTRGSPHVQPVSGVPLGLLPVPAMGRVVIPFIYKRSLHIWKIQSNIQEKIKMISFKDFFVPFLPVLINL